MLQEILALFRADGGMALSKEAIRLQLDIPADVLDQMLLTLVRKGRLIEVDEACNGCAVCPLEKICATIPPISTHGYALVQFGVD
jgi:hypothetical protein